MPIASSETAQLLPLGSDYYENRWQLDLNAMKDLVAQGESNPCRIIQAINKLHRTNEVVSSVEGQTIMRQKSFSKEVELFPTGVPIYAISSLRGEKCILPSYVRLDMNDFLVDLLYREEFDCVVELGCGFGRNLFEIVYRFGPKGIPYFGGEIAQSGIKGGELLASLQSEFDIRFFFFDFNKPDLSLLKSCKRVFVFTCHAIESVHLISMDLISTIAHSAERVVCVHLEPFGFQANPDLGKYTILQKEWFDSKNWNVNLWTTVKEASKLGIIDIEFAAQEIICNKDPGNPTSLLVWTSIG